jgi:hypothetical protein
MTQNGYTWVDQIFTVLLTGEETSQMTRQQECILIIMRFG